MNRYIEDINANESKDRLKKYEGLWNKIKDLIKLINNYLDK